MPDGRMVSRSIAWNEQLGAVSFEADYLFQRMIPFLDAGGRLSGSPKAVKAQCCPLRDQMTPEIIERCLGELDAAKLIVWYKVDEQHYAEFPGFTNHQRGARLDRETPSRLPTSSDDGAVLVRTNSRSGPAKVRVSKEKRSKVKRSKEHGASKQPDAPSASDSAEPRQQYEPDFDACWAAYPKRPNNSKRDAWRAWKSRRNAGVPAEALLAGVERYAAYCKAREIVGSEFVKRGSTFFGPGEHWAELYELGTTPPNGNGVDPAAMTLFQRYATHGLLTRMPSDDYHRIGGEMVGEGLYPNIDAFLNELRITKPWTLNDYTDDRKAAREIAIRLKTAQQPARKAS